MVQIDEKKYGVSKERLEMLFDIGTFVELGAYTKRTSNEAEFEGVVCGYGAVNGRLVFAFAQDSGRTKGAFGERHAKKISDMYSLAIKNGAPIVGIFDSAGAVVYDGASALASYGAFMSCVSKASGIVPQIAIIDGVCGGSAAVVASMFDFCITVKGISKLYVNAPSVIGGESGKSEFAAANGISALEAENEGEGFAFAKNLLSLLPQNNAEGVSFGDSDDINREISFDTDTYKIEALVGEMADNGEFIRIYEKYAQNLFIGFARFGGITSAVIASDRDAEGGVLDIKSARAAARILSFCDSFSIPVVTLVDSEGLDVSVETESAAYASELAKLAFAYTSSDNAKLSVVLGKAYGAAFTLLGSKSVGADIAYALPEAAISVLSPEASVAFVWNDKVGDKTRAEVEAEWKEKCASAAEAADKGEIDDIIEPSELRKRICAALLMLAFKADGTPSRKHAVMPL